MDIHVISNIYTYYREMCLSEIDQEIRYRRRDRYWVSIEQDPFFRRPNDTNRPPIVLTTIIDRTGYQVQIEPMTANRRYREQTMDELVEF